MLTISIYRGDQRSKAHAAFDGDFFQTIPELVFKADAGLVVCNLNRALRRALRNRKVQPAPQTYHRYYAFLDRGRTGNTEGNRPVQSCPLRVKSRTPAVSRRTSMRKPSCLISCSQPAPAGGFAAGLGRQGSQKSGKATRRNNIGAKVTRGAGESSQIRTRVL
jgi:hypothetical protein